MRTQSLRRLGAFAGTCVVLLGAMFNTNALARDSAPLTQAEQQLALAAASADIGISYKLGASLFESVHRRALLMVERRPAEKGDSRRLASVYVYDYEDDTLQQTVVDLEKDEVIHRDSMVNVQLPLIDDERQLATNILFSDPSSRESMEQEFERVTGQRLDSISQIHFKASTFVADPGTVAALQNCGQHRCVRLLMYTADNVVLDLAPVIDLSNEQVLSVLGRDRGNR